jgi:hypothetical protein
MIHDFQKTWFDAEVEAAYLAQVTAWVHAGDLDIAAEKLFEDLAEFDTPVGEICRALSEDSVELSGWEEIGDSIAQYEGDPITAVHIVMSNEPDLVFEDKSITHDPMVEVAFYTDEFLKFSELTREQLLAESLTEEPEWFGQTEDIEVYLDINGLGAINTALLRHKRQYFFRDEMHVLDEKQGLAADTVPLPYIEYRLAAMLRAVLYHQAVKGLLHGYGLSGNIPVIVGMMNTRLEIGSVYIPKTAKAVQIVKVPKLAVSIKRNMEEEEKPDVSGSSLRLNLSEEPEKKVGFFRRFFGRR